jgi:hemerythrin
LIPQRAEGGKGDETMLPLEEHDPFYVKFVDDHRELHGLVEAIEKGIGAALTANDVAAWSELPKLLQELRTHLQKHFAEEEAGGVLEEAMSRLPRLAHEVAAVERQHAPLLRLINQLAQRAQNGGLTVDQWRSLADGFGRFAYALRAHEAAENRIVEEAFAVKT